QGRARRQDRRRLPGRFASADHLSGCCHGDREGGDERLSRIPALAGRKEHLREIRLHVPDQTDIVRLHVSTAPPLAVTCSPLPASEASGGEGLGVGGAACSEPAFFPPNEYGASVVPPPRPRSLRSRGRPSPPTGGRVEAARS